MAWKTTTRRIAFGLTLLASIPQVYAETIIPDNVTIQTGDAPRVRFDQTGASGFTPWIWDIAGNDTRFYIKDVTTAGSPEVFRINAGSAANSFAISSEGNIGFGHIFPIAPVDVIKASQSGIAESLARFSVSDDSLGTLIIRNGSTTDGILHPRIEGRTASQAVPLTMAGLVSVDSGSNPVVAFDASKVTGGAVVNRPLVMFRNNLVVKARVAANGDMFATSFSPTSSRAMKDNIVDLKSQAALEALQQLTPVEYVYKDDDSGEKRVGFIAEDVPELVANADRKSVPIMDVVALVTRVVKDQQLTIGDQALTIKNQHASIEEQKKINDLLIQRLNALEARMDEKK